MKIAQHIFVSVLVLFISLLGFIFHHRWMWHSMMQIKNTSFISLSLDSYGSPLLFAGALLAVLPLYFMVNRLTAIRNMMAALLFLVITYSFGYLFYWLRLQYFIGLTEEYQPGNHIQNSIGVNSFQFELYVIFGLLTGFLISLLFFRFLKRGSVSKASYKGNHNDELIDR